MLRRMKILLGALTALVATTSLAHADDPGMQLITLMMKTPAISADGKHIAIYSTGPGGDADPAVKTSLAVFDAGGKLEQRIGVVPPATDAAKTKAAVEKINKLIDDGGYKRMSRIKQDSNNQSKTGGFTAKVESEDVVMELALEKRKLTINATRAGKKLAPVTVALPAKDGACKKVDSFSFANTVAGYNAPGKQFAFEIGAFEGDSQCFAHAFVVVLP